jgi:hypothetical protein
VAWRSCISMVSRFGHRWEGRKDGDGERKRRAGGGGGLYTCNMRLHSLVLEPLKRHTWICLRVWNMCFASKLLGTQADMEFRSRGLGKARRHGIGVMYIRNIATDN